MVAWLDTTLLLLLRVCTNEVKQVYKYHRLSSPPRGHPVNKIL